MAVTILKKSKKGGVVQVTKLTPEQDQIAKYKIKVGQVYLAANGANNGVVVMNIIEFAKNNDVLVQPISAMGRDGPERVVGAHKMSQVDFYLVEPPYIGWTKEVMANFYKAPGKRKR